MNFNILIRQIRKAYQTGSYRLWSVEDFIEVFERFYGMYEDYIGRGHPHLRTETIARVMASLVEDDNGTLYAPEDYLDSDIIEKYFDTVFNRGCDYSIVHFISGDVRYYKSFEAVI